MSSRRHKYRIQSMLYKAEDTEVICEIQGHAAVIRLKLKDIIQRKELHLFSQSDSLLLTKNFESIFNKDSVFTSRELKYYNIISTAFTVCLIMANIAEIKIFNFFGYSLGAGTIIFPLIYILNDILTEVYGFSASRRAIWLALFVNCLFSGFIYCVALLPPSEHWPDQEIFEKLFLVSPRIVFASVISYLIGEIINSSIIAALKIKFQGRFFATRAITSTLIGSLVESITFGYIAFFNRIPHIELINMIILLTVIKVAYEALAMPLTIKVTAFLKRTEKQDVYEKPSLRAIFPKIFN